MRRLAYVEGVFRRLVVVDSWAGRSMWMERFNIGGGVKDMLGKMTHE